MPVEGRGLGSRSTQEAGRDRGLGDLWADENDGKIGGDVQGKFF